MLNIFERGHTYSNEFEKAFPIILKIRRAFTFCSYQEVPVLDHSHLNGQTNE